MRTYILAALLCMIGKSVHSQSFSGFVINSAGATSSNNQLIYSIGETVVGTFSSSSNKVTQGFLQPIPRVNVTSVYKQIQNTFLFYPNPTTGLLNINNLDSNAKYNSVVIYDFHGKKVLTYGNTKEINLAELSSGNYHIVLYDNNNILEKTIITKL